MCKGSKLAFVGATLPVRSPSTSRHVRSVPVCQTYRSAAKVKLLDCIEPLQRGLVCLGDPALRREVASRISDVESLNPSQRTVEDELIFGDWRTLYTTSASILGAKRPKRLRPVELAQIIAPAERGIDITNIELIQPTNSISFLNKVTAKAKPDGYFRVDVQFQKFQLLNSLISYSVANNPKFANWLDTTYLDSEMRISRGGEGNVFVLLRAGDNDIDLTT